MIEVYDSSGQMTFNAGTKTSRIIEIIDVPSNTTANGVWHRPAGENGKLFGFCASNIETPNNATLYSIEVFDDHIAWDTVGNVTFFFGVCGIV
ncbi:MAG: hypothetical protein QM645_11320 [Asticcacaulis sp.]